MDYVYSIGKNKVVCISRYNGKSVKGVAKCDSDFDTFDENVGMKLAKLRCELKVAEKHCKQTEQNYKEAKEMLFKAEKEHAFKEQKHARAVQARNNVLEELIRFENKLINS